jgi:hypothetical protein
MTTESWPALAYDAWKDTYETVHLWAQIVGKIALAQAPKLNHSWGIAFRVTPRGLTTLTLPHGNRSYTIEFDFIDHALVIRTSEGMVRSLPLGPRTVADVYRDLMDSLRAMGLPVKIWPVTVEIPTPIRLDQDTAHHSYDPEYVQRFWRILVQLERILNDARVPFLGKCSPVHFFWGSFDLAVTRFSGRAAPPREGPEFMRDAYSREVISHGFWPGGAALGPSLYAYAVPEPAGLKEASVEPKAAYYHKEMGEFILPYDAVRTSPAPEAAIRAFVDSTYDRAATLAGWDRVLLEQQ